MTNDEKAEFATAMTKTAEGLQATQSSAALELYWEALKGYSLHEVRKALWDHIRDTERGQFFPKIADLIRQIDGDKNSSTSKAFAEALKYSVIAGTDAGKRHRWADPLAYHAYLRVGHWAFTHKQDEELERKFSKSYREVLAEASKGRKFEGPVLAHDGPARPTTDTTAIANFVKGLALEHGVDFKSIFWMFHFLEMPAGKVRSAFRMKSLPRIEAAGIPVSEVPE